MSIQWTSGANAGFISPVQVTREQLIAEARTWIGTPFHHQGRVRRVGVDCIGLIVQPARDLGIAVTDEIGYSDQPNAEHTLECLRRSFVQVPVGRMLDGDVYYIWFGVPSQPHHFGFKTDVGILHAYNDMSRGGKRIRMGRATETRLPVDWARRIHSAWRFKCWGDA